jgi:dTDP-4-amino-4,6-dideoxygalactose transaminase
VGSWGDVAIFSFGGIKLMTCGQGGMIITSDGELYSKCYAVANRGHLPNGEVNPFGIIGENFQMSELQAAILLPQLELLESYTKKREEACAVLDGELSEIEGIGVLSQFPKTQRRAHMRYSFYLKSELSGRLSRDQLIHGLKRAGIPALPAYSSAGNDPRLQQAFAGRKEDFPNSRAAEEEIVGIHHTFLLSERQVLTRLARTIRETLAES